MKSVLKSVLACLMAVGFSSAYGQMTYDVAGGHALMPESLETVSLPNGNTLSRSISHGFIWSNEEAVGGNGSLTCYGSSILDPEGMPASGSGTCDVLDLEGDSWTIFWTGAQGGKWKITGGHGKYHGMTGGGTWAVQSVYADGKTMNEWTGKWTIPAHKMDAMDKADEMKKKEMDNMK